MEFLFLVPSATTTAVMAPFITAGSATLQYTLAGKYALYQLNPATIDVESLARTLGTYFLKHVFINF